jgi:hypothetical protein
MPAKADIRAIDESIILGFVDVCDSIGVNMEVDEE